MVQLISVYFSGVIELRVRACSSGSPPTVHMHCVANGHFAMLYVKFNPAKLVSATHAHIPQKQ